MLRSVDKLSTGSGVTRNQSAAMVPAATTPMGTARRFSIEADGGWRSAVHDPSGTKSGALGISPK
jgi:hypothetical protein